MRCSAPGQHVLVAIVRLRGPGRRAWVVKRHCAPRHEFHRLQTKTNRKENRMSKTIKTMIDPDDAVMLLVDHQSGLFQLVRDIELPVLRSHVTALAKVARLAKIPTFTTASVPDGPNGPLIPEIHRHNPDAVYIPRTGQINAWDNPAWVQAIEKTKRKTL